MRKMGRWVKNMPQYYVYQLPNTTRYSLRLLYFTQELLKPGWYLDEGTTAAWIDLYTTDLEEAKAKALLFL